MKHTELRWMHIATGMLVERAVKPAGSCMLDYRLVNVTWDEPEWEDVEVVRWLTEDGKVFLLESYAIDHSATLTTGATAIIVKLTGTYRRRKPEPEVWEGVVSDIGIRRIEIMMDENAPAIHGKKVRVEVAE